MGYQDNIHAQATNEQVNKIPAIHDTIPLPYHQPCAGKARNTRIDIASQASCAIGRMSESNLINDNACT